MTIKTRNRIMVAALLALPFLMFLGFLISEIIHPTPTSLSAPPPATNSVGSPQ